jgi:plastocyanin
MRPFHTAFLSPALPKGRAMLALGVVVALGLLASAIGIRNEKDTGAPVRELTLTAQNTAFNGTNPPLELKVGEKTALTVINKDPAMTHNLVLSGLDVRTSGYLPPGAAQTLVFTPNRSGVFAYGCSLHPGLMDGPIIVLSR